MHHIVYDNSILMKINNFYTNCLINFYKIKRQMNLMFINLRYKIDRYLDNIDGI